jgi:signal transduction histidine kinase
MPLSLRRDPTRGLQVGFLALLALSIVTVGWWIADHVPYFGEVQTRLTSLFHAEAEAINTLAAGASPQDIAPLLPHLNMDEATGTVSVRGDALAAIENDTARRTNRFLWEAGFFLVVLFGGMAVLTRTLRHDHELRKRQQNFLAAVSHEFKSPLASMRLAAETLLLRSADPDSKRLGQRIVEDGDRLLRMVDNLLDTARLEEGRQTLAPQLTDLADTVERVVGEISPTAQLNQINITTSIPQGTTVSADPDALTTILRNLLDNAFKACVAGDGRNIIVRAARDGDALTLEVSDDGIGFAPQDADRLFEKFHRLGDELQRTTPGTGLGLYIVRRLAELSGATPAAHSDGPGRGATVSITWRQS